MEVRDAGENYTTSLRSWNCTPFCRIRAILYAAAIFTCILTGKAPASNDNTPQ